VAGGPQYLPRAYGPTGLCWSLWLVDTLQFVYQDSVPYCRWRWHLGKSVSGKETCACQSPARVTLGKLFRVRASVADAVDHVGAAPVAVKLEY
jgi:hypothetical protein